jgi:hypothetical protein
VEIMAVQDFSLLHTIQNDSEAHPFFYPMDIVGSLSTGFKGQGRETDHSIPSSAKVKKARAVPPISRMS